MYTKIFTRLFGVFLAIVLIAAACGGNDNATTTVVEPGQGASDDGGSGDGDCAADGADCMVMDDDDDGSDDAVVMDDDPEDMDDMDIGEDEGHDGEDNHGDGIDVPAGMAVPAISIDVAADPSSGQNLSIDLTNFTVTPENASGDPIDGEGHLHLYVDGVRVMRFYNTWLYLDLEPGDHTVEVEVSANNHSAYLVEGAPIRGAANITVPETEATHAHHEMFEVDAATAPSIDVTVSPDPKSGWNIQATVGEFTITPQNASGDHVDGEGHLHLYVDDERITRLYGEWWHLAELTEGDHEVRVDVATNDHRVYAVDGAAITGSATVTVSADEATAEAEHGDDDADHDEGGDGGDGEMAGDADVRVDVGFADGDVTVDDDRISVERGDVVMVTVNSDVPEHVHIHGYDLFIDVAAGEPAFVIFTAEVPGVFEVEFEDSLTFITELEVS
jgi:hypothetical protein